MVQTTMDPEVMQKTIDGLRKVVERRKAEQADERELVKRRKAVEEQLDALKGAPLDKQTKLEAEYGRSIRQLKNRRAQRDFLSDEQRRGLECLFSGDLFEPLDAPPVEDPEEEDPAEREQMALPLNRGDTPIGEAITHKPSHVRNLADEQPGADIAAMRIGQFGELVPGISEAGLAAIKKEAGGSLYGKTVGQFCDWLKAGQLNRLSNFIRGATIADAAAIWKAPALRPLLGEKDAAFFDLEQYVQADDGPERAAQPEVSKELEKLVGLRVATVLRDLGMPTLWSIAEYASANGGVDALAMLDGVPASAVKKLTRAIAEAAEVKPGGKPKVVKPGK